MQLTRRDIIKTGAVLATAYFLPRGARRALAGPAPDKVLVAIFLRGGADPLSLVVPAFDATYYSVRPDIAVAAGTELQLGGGDTHGFGLFPLLHRHEADVRRRRAVGAASRGQHRSVALALRRAGLHGEGGAGQQVDHRRLAQPLSRRDQQQRCRRRALHLRGAAAGDARRRAESSRSRRSTNSSCRATFPPLGGPRCRAYYASGTSDTLEAGVDAALSAVDVIQSVNTSTSVTYPNNALAKALKDVAAIIKAGIGAKVVAVDLGGWDHHTNLITQLGTDRRRRRRRQGGRAQRRAEGVSRRSRTTAAARTTSITP